MRRRVSERGEVGVAGDEQNSRSRPGDVYGKEPVRCEAALEVSREEEGEVPAREHSGRVFRKGGSGRGRG